MLGEVCITVAKTCFCITGKKIPAPELLVSGRFRPAVFGTSHYPKCECFHKLLATRELQGPRPCFEETGLRIWGVVVSGTVQDLPSMFMAGEPLGAARHPRKERG